MNNSKNPQSRLDRRKDKENRLLNLLIAAVVIAIVIVAFIVIPGGKDQSKEKAEQNKQEETVPNKEEDVKEQPTPESEAEEDDTGENHEADEEQEADDLIITEPSEDVVVEKTMIDPSWEPVPTEQVGEHVSLYDGTSVDWQEKVQALSYATGLSEDGMTIWRLKNGGSPQKSIGIVSSTDKTEKYRVYLEWVDGAGWKPTAVDILNTLDFDY